MEWLFSRAGPAWPEPGRSCLTHACLTAPDVMGHSYLSCAWPTAQDLVGRSCLASVWSIAPEFVGRSCLTRANVTGPEVGGQVLLADAWTTASEIVGWSCLVSYCLTAPEVITMGSLSSVFFSFLFHYFLIFLSRNSTTSDLVWSMSLDCSYDGAATQREKHLSFNLFLVDFPSLW